MKKRGYFSLAMLLVTTTLFAVTDIGSAHELVVIESSLSQAEQNSASTVSVITEDDIKTYNAQSTAELVGKAIGVTYASYGGLGSFQGANIRGATASRSLIFLDGLLLGSAHDSSFDLSLIPLQSIERIEVIKNGTGNLGRTNAIGGMVNIITKKGTFSPTAFTLSVENGSFLPLAKNWRSLVDSQRVDLSYTNTDIFVTIGAILAQNAYLYDNNTTLRENAHLYEGHGSLLYSKQIMPDLSFSTNNLVTYKNLGVPGSLSWGLTPNDCQNDLFISSANAFDLMNPVDRIEAMNISANYTFSQTYLHDAAWSDSKHNKHHGGITAHAQWRSTEHVTLFSDLTYGFDYVDSTDVGKNGRHTFSVGSNASFYLLDGKFSFHPSANVAYLTDTAQFSPNASLGVIYSPLADLDLKASASYAERLPTFSELYWPGMGNANLQTERGVNAELGIDYQKGPLHWEGSLFARDIFNEIKSDPLTWIPRNNDHSLYLGTEQTVSATVAKDLDLSVSYQYNKSFDLSDGQSIADNKELDNVRKHTAKASLAYGYDRFGVYLDAQYLGKTSQLDPALLVNLTISWQATERVRTYLAFDNLLNTEYELSKDYPMPGMKIRVGGSVSF